MASPFTLNPIQARSKGEIKRLRQGGFVPISIQHKGMATQHFQLESQPLNAFLRQYGEAALLDFIIAPDERRQRVIVQSVQRNPISQQLLQVTFQQIRSEDTLKTHVALLFVGEPEGVHLNQAIVQHQRDRLDIECHQDKLPDHITIDITHLRIGEVFRVSDLSATPDIKILTASDTVLASLTSTRASIAEAEAEAEATPTAEIE